ncbi:MAG: hypothetical protein ACU83V_11390 [Gammaproteobacteria bacterium]
MNKRRGEGFNTKLQLAVDAPGMQSRICMASATPEGSAKTERLSAVLDACPRLAGKAYDS